ncbi:hypothetical protein [Kutzneria sp. CA-103260]|uniref:hypothetical protein n=1 Tax=Kutzneria sp. CA-103260 TaxID=2802641 RepID=UPI001BA6EC8A|nr:hypothetical protein [Kutzneria sp. CA-103260]QUQ66151.1 hypothetical protein JJ691_38770 [Kutzneria sp. CA-103260]
MQGTIFIAAPPGTTWPLSLDDVEQQLRQRLPGVRTFHRHAAVSNTDYIDFQVTVDGLLSISSYFAGGTLILRDGSAADWADTIEWFLGLLPPGTPAVAMIEENPDEIVPVPLDATAAAIEALLDALAGINE